MPINSKELNQDEISSTLEPSYNNLLQLSEVNKQIVTDTEEDIKFLQDKFEQHKQKAIQLDAQYKKGELKQKDYEYYKGALITQEHFDEQIGQLPQELEARKAAQIKLEAKITRMETLRSKSSITTLIIEPSTTKEEVKNSLTKVNTMLESPVIDIHKREFLETFKEALEGANKELSERGKVPAISIPISKEEEKIFSEFENYYCNNPKSIKALEELNNMVTGEKYDSLPTQEKKLINGLHKKLEPIIMSKDFDPASTETKTKVSVAIDDTLQQGKSVNVITSGARGIINSICSYFKIEPKFKTQSTQINKINDMKQQLLGIKNDANNLSEDVANDASMEPKALKLC